MPSKGRYCAGEVARTESAFVRARRTRSGAGAGAGSGSAAAGAGATDARERWSCAHCLVLNAPRANMCATCFYSRAMGAGGAGLGQAAPFGDPPRGPATSVAALTDQFTTRLQLAARQAHLISTLHDTIASLNDSIAGHCGTIEDLKHAADAQDGVIFRIIYEHDLETAGKMTEANVAIAGLRGQLAELERSRDAAADDRDAAADDREEDLRERLADADARDVVADARDVDVDAREEDARRALCRMRDALAAAQTKTALAHAGEAFYLQFAEGAARDFQHLFARFRACVDDCNRLNAECRALDAEIRVLRAAATEARYESESELAHELDVEFAIGRGVPASAPPALDGAVAAPHGAAADEDTPLDDESVSTLRRASAVELTDSEDETVFRRGAPPEKIRAPPRKRTRTGAAPALPAVVGAVGASEAVDESRRFFRVDDFFPFATMLRVKGQDERLTPAAFILAAKRVYPNVYLSADRSKIRAACEKVWPG